MKSPKTETQRKNAYNLSKEMVVKTSDAFEILGNKADTMLAITKRVYDLIYVCPSSSARW